MSQRQDIEAKLALYDELNGILGAMRSFALAELKRIGRHETAQQQVMDTLALAVQDLAAYLPAAAVSPLTAQNRLNDIWVVLGSARGFCGSFNEDVIRVWRQQAQPGNPTFLVGERLRGLLAGDDLIGIPGAESGLDASAAIDRILDAVAALRLDDPAEFGLIVCVRDDRAARCQRLWPLLSHAPASAGYPPLTLMPAAEVAVGAAEHYLYHSLLALLLCSIRVENHMRLLQMENALRPLDEGYEDLQRRRNRLRQEEIVQEIELMARRH